MAADASQNKEIGRGIDNRGGIEVSIDPGRRALPSEGVDGSPNS